MVRRLATERPSNLDATVTSAPERSRALARPAVGPSVVETGSGAGSVHLFVLGLDYHLGDLLWLTPVLAEYRRRVKPERLLLGCPDRPISQILEHCPPLDELLYGEADQLLAASRARFGRELVTHDLRPLALAGAMLQDWRHHWPWLYFRDLWLRPRGQWLATFLHLGQLHDHRPVIQLRAEDRAALPDLPARFVALAPHVGRDRLPLAGCVWRRIKEWDLPSWVELAREIRAAGFEPLTLAAAGQPPIPGTRPVLGLPIRQVAAIVEQAAALVSVESGLWFIAAATKTPFLIVPWWLPRSVDWAAPMNVPHRLICRQDASVERVFLDLQDVADQDH